MKTNIFMMTAIAVLFVTSAFATKLPSVKVVSLKPEKALVTFEADDAKQVELTLKDQTGAILYYKRTTEATTSHKTLLNFSEMEDGLFTLITAYDNCKIVRQLELENQQVKVGGEMRAYDPFFNFKDNKLYVSCLNPSLHNIYLSIYEDGKRISRSRLGKDMTIHKSYDLARLQKGDFEFVVSDHYGEYSFYVQK